MKLRKSNVRLVALSCFYLLYVVIGASIFSAIEGPQERQQVKALKSLRSRFLTKHHCLRGKLGMFVLFLFSDHQLMIKSRQFVPKNDKVLVKQLKFDKKLSATV